MSRLARHTGRTPSSSGSDTPFMIALSTLEADRKVENVKKVSVLQWVNDLVLCPSVSTLCQSETSVQRLPKPYITSIHCSRGRLPLLTPLERMAVADVSTPLCPYAPFLQLSGLSTQPVCLELKLDLQGTTKPDPHCLPCCQGHMWQPAVRASPQTCTL